MSKSASVRQAAAAFGLLTGLVSLGLVIVALYSFIGTSDESRREQHLWSDGIQATANVDGFDNRYLLGRISGKTYRVVYSFRTIDGRAQPQLTSTLSAAEAAQIKPGQQISIHYDADKPSNAVPDIHQTNMSDAWIALGWFGGLGVLSGLISYVNLRPAIKVRRARQTSV